MIRFVLWLILKRLWNERRLAAALLIGMTVTATLVSSVLIYADGSVERLLSDRWDPGPMGQAGAVLVRHVEVKGRQTDFAQYSAVTDLMAGAPERLGLPAQASAIHGSLAPATVRAVGSNQAGDPARPGELSYLSTLHEHIRILDGRLPSGGLSADFHVEAIIDKYTADSTDLVVGRTYRYPVGRVLTSPLLHVTIVGVFQPTDPLTPYWPYRPPFNNALFVTAQGWEEILRTGHWELGEVAWYWLADHTRIRAGNADAIVDGLLTLESRLAQLMPDTRLAASPLQVLQGFARLASGLRTLLLMLLIPTAGLVLYYTVMASGLIARQGAAEIAVIKSRGGSGTQILLVYLGQWLVLGGLALAIGPPLGLLGARIIGSASGFLELVARRPLPVDLTARTYLYTGVALLVSIVAGLVPVLAAAARSIVAFKVEEARPSRPPLYQRLGLDLILLGAAIWGYRLLAARTAEPAADGTVDPTLFVAPAFFMLACALVAVRTLPWLARGLAWLAGRGRGVVLHSALGRIARAPQQYTAILALLIMTVSMGIYNALAARTLEANFVDREWYRTGADLIITERRGAAPDPDGAGSVTGLVEPPLSLHEDLPGVRKGARVYGINSGASVGGRGIGQVEVMMIDPAAFGEVAFFRRDFAPFQLNAYLNNLLRYRDGVLIASGVAAEAGLRLGDRLTLQVRSTPVSLRVVGILDYWPTYYPPQQRFLVVNLDQMQDAAGLMPYDWWFAMEPGARVAPVVEELRARGLTVTGVTDTRSRVNEKRQEPQRTGLYGQLSVGFLGAVGVTVLGTFLYTLVSLRSRVVEFGVLRAMGLTVGQLVGMLAVEHLFTIGIGLVGGTLLGLVSGEMFLPMLQVTADALDRVPPFLVVGRRADVAKIIAVLGGTFALLLPVLTALAVRLRVAQAVKLGEDR